MGGAKKTFSLSNEDEDLARPAFPRADLGEGREPDEPGATGRRNLQFADDLEELCSDAAASVEDAASEHRGADRDDCGAERPLYAEDAHSGEEGRSAARARRLEITGPRQRRAPRALGIGAIAVVSLLVVLIVNSKRQAGGAPAGHRSIGSSTASAHRRSRASSPAVAAPPRAPQRVAHAGGSAHAIPPRRTHRRRRPRGTHLRSGSSTPSDPIAATPRSTTAPQPAPGRAAPGTAEFSFER